MDLDSVRGRSHNGLFDLHGRRAVVIGAARGIGRAAAQALGRQGADLLLFDRLETELVSTATQLSDRGVTVDLMVGDVTAQRDVRSLLKLARRTGVVDVLVNCAGIIRRMPIEELSLADLDAQWDVNVRATVEVTQAFLPEMQERRAGKVINVGSLGSVVGLEGRTAYATTKGAVAQYTVSLASEVGKDNVCVNAVAPGYVRTAMNAGWLEDPRRERRLLERIPLGRIAMPEDLEGAFVFLAAPASDYVTGQVLLVDGGWTAT